jgi:dTMP kinase
MTNRRGFFITFEGPDGSGKSTQCARLAARLRAAQQEVVENVEPGGTPIGQQIRKILLDPANHEISPTAEMLLMFAARAQNVDQVILPALRAGKIVVSDRFTDSTLAYQGGARGLGSEIVLDADRIACRGLVPNLTFLIDIDVETGLARAKARNKRVQHGETRLDDQEVEFHRKVRKAYLQIAGDEPNRVRVVDGNRAPDEVSAEVWSIVGELLGARV